MRTGRTTPIPRPLSLAVAVVTAFAAAILVTGVVNAAIVTFTADLTAEAEVPNPVPDGATGSAVITVDDETNEVCFELTIDGIGHRTRSSPHTSTRGKRASPATWSCRSSPSLRPVR